MKNQLKFGSRKNVRWRQNKRYVKDENFRRPCKNYFERRYPSYQAWLLTSNKSSWRHYRSSMSEHGSKRKTFFKDAHSLDSKAKIKNEERKKIVYFPKKGLSSFKYHSVNAEHNRPLPVDWKHSSMLKRENNAASRYVSYKDQDSEKNLTAQSREFSMEHLVDNELPLPVQKSLSVISSSKVSSPKHDDNSVIRKCRWTLTTANTSKPVQLHSVSVMIRSDSSRRSELKHILMEKINYFFGLMAFIF